MRRILLSVLVLGLLCVGRVSAAETVGPEQLVKSTTQEVLKVLEEHEEEVRDDPRKVYGYVKELVFPHFDFELMSRFVLAQGWRKASPEQRDRFVGEFRQLLVRTYGKSLSEYSGQEVEFPAMQSDPARGRVTVPTRIIQPDGPSIPVDYNLRKTDEGWKVFDVVIDGVSLVQNYRGSFASEMRRGGIDALIDKLAERNASKGASE